MKRLMLQEIIAKLFKYEHCMALLVGSLSVKYLRRYIYGSADAFLACGYPEVADAFGHKWEDYVEDWFDTNQTCGWDNLIINHSDSDNEAVALFYQILRMYLYDYYPQVLP